MPSVGWANTSFTSWVRGLKGIAVPDADRAELQAGLNQLAKEIDGLRTSLKSKAALLELLPDVEIFHKAVRWALARRQAGTEPLAAWLALGEAGLEGVAEEMIDPGVVLVHVGRKHEGEVVDRRGVGALVLLDVDAREQVVADEAVADDDRVLVVAALPAHERDHDVLAEGQLAVARAAAAFSAVMSLRTAKPRSRTTVWR